MHNLLIIGGIIGSAARNELLCGFLLYASYYGTDQSQAQRRLSARDMGVVRKTLLFNGLIRFPVTLTYCVMGLIIGISMSLKYWF